MRRATCIAQGCRDIRKINRPRRPSPHFSECLPERRKILADDARLTPLAAAESAVLGGDESNACPSCVERHVILIGNCPNDGPEVSSHVVGVHMMPRAFVPDQPEPRRQYLICGDG